jgi:hypothetical protein
MAKNLGRKFATMTEDERRRFALLEDEGTTDQPAELDLEEPRKAASRQDDSSSESE